VLPKASGQDTEVPSGICVPNKVTVPFKCKTLELSFWQQFKNQREAEMDVQCKDIHALESTVGRWAGGMAPMGAQARPCTAKRKKHTGDRASMAGSHPGRPDGSTLSWGVLTLSTPFLRPNVYFLEASSGTGQWPRGPFER
jgi:hypothetical protein